MYVVILLMTSRLIIAETFNDYFSKIGYETGQNVPMTDQLF